MKRWLAWAVLLSMFVSGQVFAAKSVRLELNDGSAIQGEIVSVANGVYTIKSSSLGVIKIDESKIRTIEISQASLGAEAHAQASSAQPAQPGVNEQAQALRDRMTGDQETMGLIPSLANMAINNSQPASPGHERGRHLVTARVVQAPRICG